MHNTSLTIRAEQFAELFPFYLLFDQSFRVLQCGRAWAKMPFELASGSQLNQILRFERPRLDWNFEVLRERAGALLVLSASHLAVKLRGGLTYLDESNALLFLGSPWMTDIRDLGRLGLTLHDFGPHDPSTDLLFLLQAQNNSLQELSVLAEEVTKAKESAENAMAVKDEFLMNMSHELRTPLNGVRGMSELLLTTEMTAEQQDFTYCILNAAEMLTSTVTTMLDVSKFGQGGMILQESPFNLQDVLMAAVESLRADAERKGLALRVNYPATMARHFRGDADRLKEVLVKLMSNAVKFTNCGSVEISANAMLDDPKLVPVQINVRDTGIGIAPEDLSRIFEPFTQVDSSITRAYGGSGLGLTFCKQIVEFMNGELKVESTVGTGSTFSVCIPLQMEQNDPSLLTIEGSYQAR